MQSVYPIHGEWYVALKLLIWFQVNKIKKILPRDRVKQVDLIQSLIVMDYIKKLNLDCPNPTEQVVPLVIVLIGQQEAVEQHFDYLKAMIHFHLILVAVDVAAAVLPIGLTLVAGPELVALVDL